MDEIKQDQEYVNHRDYIRMEVESPIKFVRIHDATSHYGQACNLSGGGILFKTEDHVNIGEQIEITVAPQAGQFVPLKASVIVTRVDNSGFGKNLVAGKIVKIL